MGPMKLVGIPIKMSQTPGSIRRPPPLVGEHNREVYCDELGLSRQKLAALKKRGVI